ncbi:8-oxo-dGTP pyrophosphatase MutT (NUDIX family) [Evansella vedderi]|uniref:8-oxo-dGTP pyrophosphatase MutT (NUDIX family) n=1 Tax=Evansella vedderi TaxID=38282 RepID=A0ABT9ZQ60_9BACI|nr:NUDIX domain-containing protein [Evansella vedderi]MDQ0253339.1 8-oxo-dGTP pyrophosphatase MutT (NUDIX family) [Evansella vedderi]
MTFHDTFIVGAHAIIVNNEGLVLLLKRTYGDLGWSLPGGGVEVGETIHEALYRECREELGVEVQDAILTGFYYHSKLNAQVGIFRCSLPEGAEIKLSHEHSDYKWAHLSELSEVQRIRAVDALEYKGQVISRAF